MARKKNLNFKKLQFSIIQSSTRTFSFLFVLFLALLPTDTYATSCDQWVAEVVSAEGKVESRRTGETGWQQVSLNETFCAGDMIRVLENSRAGLAFANQPLLRLDQNSTIALGEIKEESSGLTGMLKGAASLDLIKGVAHFFSRLPRNLEVRTGFVNAGVEGTEFLIKVDDTKTSITVFEGKVLAANSAGSLGLTSGQSAVTEKGKAPVLQTVVNPRDAVRWALYYPPVIYGSDPNASINQAAQLLAVGRVDEAKALIQQTPQNSNALSLLSIIAVVENNKEKARNLADQAIAADPESSTPRIALSYAQQANFDLAGARQSLEKAVELEPDNALAQARLAEIYSSFGDLTKALATAEKAASIEPNLSRTQTVLGFAYLTQVKTDEAKVAFNNAVSLDQGDPLPHLGLGLAIIRDGDLAAGSKEIETAASLDPNNALIRSYLGKTYYEQKRSNLDGREYATAKELDPNDPTPWFYDAIRKQTINRPVEALHDMQKAIELNNNRAVYRSKLMLDSDLASRSSSLARIYNNLGFQQRGLVEGWNSVNTDPTNFSAHRFLADTYSALPRHEIARVSELLQSQLLQPINISPIQPQLAESNLFLISSQGPGAAGFNTYNPLFNRNGATAQISGMGGENGTWGAEGVVSAIYDKLSLSAGYTGFGTDGYWDNNDQSDDIANFFAQYEISYKTSVQAEYRYRNTETGDLRLKFFDESIYPTQRLTSENNTFRLGAKHAFSPGSILLGSFIYQDSSFREKHEPFPQPGVLLVDFDQPDQKSVGGELEYLYRSQYVNFIGGGGYFDVEDKLEQLLRFGPPMIPGPPFSPPTIDIPGETDLDLQHANVYAYSYITPLEDLTFTIGASYDDVDSEEFLDENKNQFNPKFGVVWNPLPSTTVRAAAFRTLKRTLITQQTLEPTQVAGFNQFFDDDELSEAWRYGGAIDQQFSSDIYGGLELSKREIKVPYLDFTANPFAPPTSETEWDEFVTRAYLFWTPHEWLALRAEYIFEKFEREQPVIDGAENADTHRVPLGVSFFHPSGLNASLTATYYDQSGDFGGFFVTDPIQKGSSEFWLVDLAINYRLPSRYGFITIGAANLFDEDFRYFDSDLNNASIQPGRTVFASFTLALP